MPTAMKRRHSAWVAWSLVCTLWLSACGDDSPTLVVDVVTGIVPVAQFSRTRVDLLVDDGAGGYRQIVFRVSYPNRSDDYAHGFRIAEFGEVAAGEYTVQVVFLLPDGRPLIQRRTRIRITGNYALRVHLTPNCIGVACPSPGGNAGYSECLDGHCVDPRCNPPSTEFCEGVEFCGTTTDCRETASCAEATCIDGVCDAAPLEDGCAEFEWCDPLVGQGCEPLIEADGGVELDGGVDDGGDAAVDSGVACGATCVDPSDICRFGTIDCSGETPTCVATLVRTGAVCGDGMVCNPSGSCVACSEGGECQVGCATGQLTCTTGQPACLVTEASPRLPTGSTCETSCGEAGICPTPHVCSDAGSCIECIDGAPCAVGCELGAISCAMGGTCVLNNTHVAPFTPCGALHVCDGAGECVTCEDGASYEDGCFEGTIVGCSTAAPAPATRTLRGATSDCGETEVCSGDGFGCYVPYRALDIAAMSYDPEDAANVRATCAVTPEHTVQCWGNNASGALGWGFTYSPPVHSKVDVVGLHDVEQISGGTGFFCARTALGEVWCWGRNAFGELGDGTFERAFAPVRTQLPEPAIDVAAGGYHACAIGESHHVYCWGQVPRPAPIYAEYVRVPEEVPTLTNAVKLQAFRSEGGTCALLSDGHVACWGLVSGTVFGDGVMHSSFDSVLQDVPAYVVGIDDAIDFAHNGFVGCVVRESHEVWCWGGSEYWAMLMRGAFGDTAGTYQAAAPVHADLLSAVVSDAEAVLMSGDVLVRRAGGETWTFGSGRPPEPAPSPLDHVQSIKPGYSHQCAITGDGYAVCWGTNTTGSGELGTGHGVPSTSSVPLAVMGEAS